jgi:hypothetical protein
MAWHRHEGRGLRGFEFAWKAQLTAGSSVRLMYWIRAHSWKFVTAGTLPALSRSALKFFFSFKDPVLTVSKPQLKQMAGCMYLETDIQRRYVSNAMFSSRRNLKTRLLFNLPNNALLVMYLHITN